MYAVSTGIFPDASTNLQLRFVKRIKFQTLQCPGNWPVCAMCAVSDDIVLLSFNKNGLFALSMQSGQLLPRKPCELKRVIRMAFDVQTDTLLLVLRTPRPDGDCWRLASMRRGAEVPLWNEVDRLTTEFEASLNSPMISVCESRVLFGAGSSKYICAFDLYREHNLRHTGKVDVISEYKFLSCTRMGADYIIALSHQNSVSLHRLVGLQLEPLATIASTQLLVHLFKGQLLFGTRWKGSQIISFLVTDSGLNNLQPKVLLDSDVGINVNQCCIVGDRLIMRDNTSKDFLLYDFE